MEDSQPRRKANETPARHHAHLRHTPPPSAPPTWRPWPCHPAWRNCAPPSPSTVSTSKSSPRHWFRVRNSPACTNSVFGIAYGFKVFDFFPEFLSGLCVGGELRDPGLRFACPGLVCRALSGRRSQSEGRRPAAVATRNADGPRRKAPASSLPTGASRRCSA